MNGFKISSIQIVLLLLMPIVIHGKSTGEISKERQEEPLCDNGVLAEVPVKLWGECAYSSNCKNWNKYSDCLEVRPGKCQCGIPNEVEERKAKASKKKGNTKKDKGKEKKGGKEQKKKNKNDKPIKNKKNKMTKKNDTKTKMAKKNDTKTKMAKKNDNKGKGEKNNNKNKSKKEKNSGKGGILDNKRSKTQMKQRKIMPPKVKPPKITTTTVKPDKPGSCPSIDVAGMCFFECFEDSDCSDDNKCCFNGCGKNCFKPRLHRGIVQPEFCGLGPLTIEVVCSGKTRKYVYNNETNYCEEYYYGGCNGTKNLFTEILECEDVCGW